MVMNRQYFFSMAADGVVCLHFAFVLFVVLGGFLLLWSRRVAWFHLPAAIWGVLIEIFGWICPLTPLENFLRHQAGEAGYASGFIEHYILPLLYPVELTRLMQYVLGAMLFIFNVLIYAFIFYGRKK